jgi:hypothetical protein
MNSHHVIAIYVLLGHANFAKMMKIVFDIDVDCRMDEFLKWLTTWKGLRMKVLESRMNQLKQLKQERSTLTITTSIDADIVMIESLLLRTFHACLEAKLKQLKQERSTSTITTAIDADIEMIESLLLQTSRAHQLRSRRTHISKVLGAGGGVLVENALALDNKSLADATDEDVNAVIKSFDSQLYQTH